MLAIISIKYSLMSKGCLVCCFALEFDFVPDEQIPGQGKKCVTYSKLVGFMDKDLNKMYHVFAVADSGIEDDHLDVSEFLQYAKVDSNFFQLGKLIFGLFAGNDMKLDFYEFLKSMFFFLSQSRTELAMFAFQLFDPDDSDSLTGEELRTLANCVNPGANMKFGGRRYKRLTLNETIDRGLSLFDLDGDEEISSSEFLLLIFNNKNLKIMNPFFNLQKRLRETTLGTNRWKYLETYRNRVLYEINVHTKEAHPNKEAMKKCLFFSRRFGLKKIFQLNGVPESSYLETYDIRHNNDEKNGRSKDETNSNVKGTEKNIKNMNQKKERRPSKTVRKGSVVPSDDHEHYQEIVKIQSRMRGVIGRQNSEKLRLEKGMEESVKKSSIGEKKPRRSSISGNKHSGSAVSAVAVVPIQQHGGELDDKVVRIQKRVRGVIGRQNSEKQKIERSKQQHTK